jgi:phosphoglycerate kinase
MKLKTLDNLEFDGKTVILRCDLNVPLDKNGKVTDITKIKRHKATIDELINKKAKILVISHLGRPKGKEITKLSLNNISDEFVKVMNIKEITVLPYCRPEVIDSVLKDKQAGSITLMENIRFYPEEEENNQKFARELANVADYFVNDAFSVSHRKHISTYSLSNLLPSYLGRSLELELTMLSKINENINKPVMAIIGGSKISTKINLLSNLVKKVDYLVIGGAMANTFLLERGYDIGSSLVEKDKLDIVKNVLQQAKENNCKIVLPKEVVVSKSLNDDEEPENIDISKMRNDLSIFDVGEKTIEEICNTASMCKTIFWNGPLGVYETPPFDNSTNIIGRTIAILTKGKLVTSVVGGGDTVAALNNAELTGGFSYVSIAGGALVEWLEGKKLPGLLFLEN